MMQATDPRVQEKGTYTVAQLAIVIVALLILSGIAINIGQNFSATEGRLSALESRMENYPPGGWSQNAVRIDALEEGSKRREEMLDVLVLQAQEVRKMQDDILDAVKNKQKAK